MNNTNDWIDRLIAWADRNGVRDKFPRDKEEVINLKELNLSSSVISLPSEIGNLVNLKELDLSENYLTSIPKEIGNLVNLKGLNLSENQLIEIPKEIGNLVNLKELDLGDNHLTEIPIELNNIPNLHLYLQVNKYDPFPLGLWDLTNLQANKDGSFPRGLWDLTNLKGLWLSAIREIPKEIGNLVNLECLYLGGFIFGRNKFTSLSRVIGNLVFGEWLSLSRSNQLKEIPKEIGNLVNLEKLNLSENQLIEIPKEIGNLVNLKELDLGDNQLTEIPIELNNISYLFISKCKQRWFFPSWIVGFDKSSRFEVA